MKKESIKSNNPVSNIIDVRIIMSAKKYILSLISIFIKCISQNTNVNKLVKSKNKNKIDFIYIF